MSRTPALVALLLSIALSTTLVAGAAAGTVLVSVTADVDPDQPAVDEEFDVVVEVSNAADSDRSHTVRSVELRDGAGDDADVLDEVGPPRGTVEPGATETVTLSTELGETGTHDLLAVATVERDGTTYDVETTVPVTVTGAEPRLEIDAERAVEEAWRPLEVTAANGEDEPLRSVSVHVDGEAVEFASPDAATSEIEPGEAFVATFDARPATAGIHPVEVTVSYVDPDGERREVVRTLDADLREPDAPGRVELLSVSASGPPDAVEITGDAANVGSADVESVRVAVVDEDGVNPTAPQPDFFVGGVDESDFGSFTVNAAVDAERDSVPIEVTYLVDGVERTETTTVSYDAAAHAVEEPPEEVEGGGGLPLLPLGGVVGALLIVGVGWRLLR